MSIPPFSVKKFLRHVLNFISWFTYHVNIGLYPRITTISTAEYAEHYYQDDDSIYVLFATFGEHEGWYAIDWRLPPVPVESGCYYVNGEFVMPRDFRHASMTAAKVTEYDDIPF